MQTTFHNPIDFTTPTRWFLSFQSDRFPYFNPTSSPESNILLSDYDMIPVAQRGWQETMGSHQHSRKRLRELLFSM
jgi:hypothetical protein